VALKTEEEQQILPKKRGREDSRERSKSRERSRERANSKESKRGKT